MPQRSTKRLTSVATSVATGLAQFSLAAVSEAMSEDRFSTIRTWCDAGGARCGHPAGGACGEIASKRVGPAADIVVSEMRLVLSVSRDEEYVSVDAEWHGANIPLGARAHHYLLLTLARQRAADRERGFPETSCGWVNAEDLCLDHGSSISRINLDVYRIRRQLEALGMADARAIVERRPLTKQLRIGVAKISIRRL